MKPKNLAIELVIFLLVTSYCTSLFYIESGRAVPTTLYVGEGEEYTTIQSAIDAANTATGGLGGYRIIVYNGTYTEDLSIPCKLDIFGEDKINTIINGGGTGIVIRINASFVNISRFTIRNGGSSVYDSIIRINANNAIITDCNISSGYHGIMLNNSDRHRIYDNIMRDNTGDGIYLNQSDNNVNISYNTISNNNNGIYLYSSDGNNIYNNVITHNNANGTFLNSSCDSNIIRNNNMSSNTFSGLHINDFSNYSTVTNNNIYNNGDSGIIFENSSMNLNVSGNTIAGHLNYGIMLVGSTSNLSSNTIRSNSKDGIYLNADDNTTLFGNTIRSNTLAGIRLLNSTSDYVFNNVIYSNGGYGAYLDFFTLSNTLYNNKFYSNGDNAIDKSMSSNAWYTTERTATNIIGGPNIYGNYWDDYTGSDTDDDGIGETAYTVYASNTDPGPLVDNTNPSISSKSVSPSSQALGSATTFSTVVTDNIAVVGVYVIVAKPNGLTSNLTITSNKSGNTYTGSHSFKPHGNYTYYIRACDAHNWVSSSTGTFRITEGVPPSITDNSPTTGSPFTMFTFNATVTDDVDIAANLTVKVHWSHGNEGGNYTMSNTMGNYFQRDVLLDNSTSDLYYYFYAQDRWGNGARTVDKVLTISDAVAPTIDVKKYGPNFDQLPNSYFYRVNVTDNVAVSNVTIEYWYNNSAHRNLSMNNTQGSRYQITIVEASAPGHLYCIIYADDGAGNQRNTKSPIVRFYDSSFLGDVSVPVTLNANESFDLDGEITNYSWTFGDGTTGYGVTPKHTYSSEGNYTITCIATDDHSNTGTNTSYVRVILLNKIEASSSVMNAINSTYGVDLSETFYAYDTDGDGIVDAFHDPNGVLKTIGSNPRNFSGNITFLLSINDSVIPEFFWNTTNNSIIPISYLPIEVDEDNISIDEANERATITVTINKTGWLFLEIDDRYQIAALTVYDVTNDREISSDMIWRTNGKIYVLDDPATNYSYVFDGIYPTLETPTFTPGDSGIINEYSQNITVTYNVPVGITSAFFNLINVTVDLVTTDNLTFTYSPLPNLDNGTYAFEIYAYALQGSQKVYSEASYIYTAWVFPPQQSFFEKYWMIMALFGFLGGLAVALIVFRVKQVTLDDFVYIKSKRILPFFKTIVVGPVSINVDHENISKAEFYVDKELKDTVTDPPYLWKWKEAAFLKHTIETKIYDEEGNEASSGEMDFYIFNPFKSK